jgi:hypothetical protein
MIPPPDPFAQQFDSIEIDPARAPSQTAIESAMALSSPHEDMLTASAAAPDIVQPGFSLLDDAGGRFVVDRDMGVVTFADETQLNSERGDVHAVRLRVVEPSGSTYELDMQLRITGRVPQMVGAEEFAAIAGLTDDTIVVATRVPVLVTAAEPEQAPAIETVAPPPAQIAWTRFSAAQAHAARLPRLQPRRGFIAAEAPDTEQDLSFEFDGLPAPLPAHLPWSL